MTEFTRSAQRSRLSDLGTVDLVVIGAGMTGAGVAVDAAARGLSVVLLDKGDFGSGTSSKSSKMAHGGLRYLQQKEFRLVYENLRERQRLLTNAPHLISPLPFLIPLFGSGGVVSKTVTKAYASALRLYDLTGGWRIGRRYRQITRDEALGHIPTLRADKLVAGFLYYDARGDDARVALTLVRTAHEHGALCLNYASVTGLTRNSEGLVVGVTGRDHADDSIFEISARAVVNATGVWADDIFHLEDESAPSRITPAKGVHITVPADRLPCDVAAVFPVPGERRSIFVLPFDDSAHTFIGTTDTPYEGDIDTPLCTADDVAYLLRAVNAATSSNLTSDDVTGVWAGLRPLLKPRAGTEISERTADLSRRHQVESASDGLIHITGGKWTTYRKMAEDTVDEVVSYLGRRRRCTTVSLALSGSGPAPSTSDAQATYLFHRFGTRGSEIAALIARDPSAADTPITGLPHSWAEFEWICANEMVVTVEDLLTRRTRAYLHDARATVLAARSIAERVAATCGWSSADIDAMLSSFYATARLELSTAGLSIEGLPK